MTGGKLIDAVLRPKRQITIPREICEQLGINPGDILELIVDNSVMITKPKKNIALDALQEIQNAFKRSRITEEELQEAGRQVRQEIIRKRYAAKSWTVCIP